MSESKPGDPGTPLARENGCTCPGPDAVLPPKLAHLKPFLAHMLRGDCPIHGKNPSKKIVTETRIVDR